MKAMILAAGEGKRMRPLTSELPKPLLEVGGKRLIDYHLEKLARLGFEQVIINVAYLGEKVKSALGTTYPGGMQICYSVEPEPLETAGAIMHALEYLGEHPFILINGDIWTEYDFATLQRNGLMAKTGVHLVMVPNPAHHSDGDYLLDRSNRVCLKDDRETGVTFSGISVIDPQWFGCYPHKRKKFPLREVFAWGIGNSAVTGEYYQGEWYDIGTPAALEALNVKLNKR